MLKTDMLRAAIARRTRFHVDTTFFSYIAFGILVGRVALPGGFAPFAAAYVCALYNHSASNTLRFVAGLVGVAVGIALRGNLNHIFMQALCVLLSCAILMAHYAAFERRATIFAAAVVAAASTLLSGVFFAVVGGLTTYALVAAVLQGAAAFILACVFRMALVVPALRTKYSAQCSASKEQHYAFFVLVAISTLALSDVGIDGFNAQSIASIVLILLAAHIGGVQAAGAAGAVVGLLCGVGTDLFLPCIGAYALLGVFSGVCAKIGKPGVIAGVIVGGTLITILLSDVPPVSPYEVVIAAACYAILPGKCFAWLSRMMTRYESDERLRQARTVVSKQVSAVSAALDKLSASIASAKHPSETGTITASALFDTVSERVCLHCDRHRHCWHDGISDTYGALLKGVPALKSKGCVQPTDLPASFADACVDIDALTRELSRLYQRYKLDALWKRKIGESRQLACQQLDGVSALLQALSQQVTAPPPDLVDEPVFAVQCSAATRNKPGELLCGDCYTYLPVGRYFLLALSDGMGGGEEANAQSSLALSFLEDFLHAGFDISTALQLINSVLLLRSNEDTYATLDVALLDVYTGECQFVKVGANTTYVRRGPLVEQMACTSLPVGILRRVEPQIARMHMSSGDYIILCTDGVHSPLDDWARTFIGSIEIASPAVIADAILKESLRRNGGEPSDDMAVLVALIKS